MCVVRAYKWLEAGRIEPSRELAWPSPGDESGGWVDMKGPVGHESFALRASALASAATTELWEVELARPLQECDGLSNGKLLAERGRLVRPVAAWSERLAHDHLRDCQARSQHFVASALAATSRHVGERPDGAIATAARELQEAIADDCVHAVTVQAVRAVATRSGDPVNDAARKAVELFEHLPGTIGSATEFGLARKAAGSICRVTGLLARLTAGVETMASSPAAARLPDQTVARDAEASAIADIDEALARRLRLPID